jgi:hypothetical protein
LVDNGGGLIYDTVLDITWAQPDDTFILGWYANTWAAGLTLGGVNGWRLPYISVAEGAGPFTGTPLDCSTASESACRDNELGYMFYQNLGGTQGQPILDSGDPDLVLFPTLQSVWYWSSTAWDSNNYDAWSFSFSNGDQFPLFRDNHLYPWAVHSGNVVPVPPAVWLFGSGFLGLIGMARRRKTT